MTSNATRGETGAQPTARLTVLSAGTAGARAASRREAEQLIYAVDWSALAAGLSERHLLALLGERILATADGRAPEWFAQATNDAIARGSQRESMLALISIQIMHSLKAAGIPSLALKGPLLGERIYGQPGRRPSADIDLLVASEDLPRAINVAAQIGYHPQRDPIWSDGLPMLHFELSPERRSLPPLELHWRIHWYEREFSRDLLMRSVEDGVRIRRATLADEFTSLLLFYARDGFVDLRAACDLAGWWDKFGGQLAPGVLDEVIDRYPALERALLAALAVTDRTVGVPSGALLSRYNDLERRVRLATRLANPHARGTPRQRSADVWLVDWLLTPHGGRQECVRRQLLGSDEVRRALDDPLGPALAYSIRALQLLRRYTLSLLRIALRARRARTHSRST